MRLRISLSSFAPRSAYDVLALLAFLIAVGTGGAYAANTIGSDDIIDESIISADIKDGEVKVRDIGLSQVIGTRVADGSLTTADIGLNAIRSDRVLDNSLTGADVAPNTLTDADINEATLGGTARAYGFISPLCSGTPSLCPVDRSKGITRVERIDTGRYCIRVDGATPVTDLMLTSVEYQKTANPETMNSALWWSSNACAGGDFVVVTQRQSVVDVRATDGGVTTVADNSDHDASDIAFTVLVP